ncbi:MAG: uracil phosphoribosyltransferase [Planctomycetota bacterium]
MPTDASASLMQSHARVTVVGHPLIQQHLTTLRNEETSPADFRLSVRRLATLLAYEATKDLRCEETPVETPLTTATGHRLCERITLTPILRAGLGMVDPVLDLIPTAEVWHLGLYRDEATARPVSYYNKLPEGGATDVALVVDPMLATGGSAVAALKTLAEWGVPRLKLLSIIASSEGVATVESEFPEAQIYVCAVDAELNNQKFIVPGLGDAGDRTFNTPR